MDFRYTFSTLSFEEVRRFLLETDKEFPTPLSESVDINDYARKLSTYSDFSLCYYGDELIGMISCYTNRPPMGYISNVCVKKDYQGRGVFQGMFVCLLDKVKHKKISVIRAEVDIFNYSAINTYLKRGFILVEARAESRKLLIEYRCDKYDILN